MTVALVIATLFVGLFVREALFRRHLRRLASQRLRDDFDLGRFYAELRASCDRIERRPDDGGGA